MENLVNAWKSLKELVGSVESDFVKLTEKGNKAAGTRVRKGMMDIKKLAQEVRVLVQEAKVTEKK
jgi:hypothetical protein